MQGKKQLQYADINCPAPAEVLSLSKALNLQNNVDEFVVQCPEILFLFLYVFQNKPSN
jgi:hypothetical protein